MGCNSHLVIEVGHERETKMGNRRDWYTWSTTQVQESRDYLMYGLMAGVRSEFPESRVPRGIPTDASYQTRELFGLRDDNGKDVDPENTDYHSHSWLTPLEFVDVCKLYEAKCQQDGYEDEDDIPMHREWKALAEVLLVLSRHWGVQNVRLVFAFDN